MTKRVLTALSVVLAWVALQPGALASGGGDESFPPAATAADSDYAAGEKAVQQKDWKAALADFDKVAARNPDNASAQNYLGYAYRNLGQFDLAFEHYERALRLNPQHRGAHEYLGETYLLVNNLAKAEEQLQALNRLCVFGCEEYDDLKKAIAEYKTKTAGK